MSKPLTSAIVAAVICVTAAAPPAGYGQEIEFLGKNGEKVELKPNIEVLPNQPGPRAARPQLALPNRTARPLIGGLPSLKGRTLMVTTPDGDTKEISTDDARSIIINRSFRSVNQDGQQQIQQGGTATIVAADGETYEVDLSQLQNGEIEADEANKTIQAKRIEIPKSYMIGVFCEPVPEMLSSQLDLEQGIGLLVREVQKDSPASISGIRKHDVLLYADDQVLSSLQDLNDAVTESGSQEQAFSLTVMRGGKEMPIEITARQREPDAGLMLGKMPLGGLRMNDLGPGLIFDDGFGGGFEDGMMEQMRNQMEQVREEMKRMDAILRNQKMPLPAIPRNGIR